MTRASILYAKQTPINYRSGPNPISLKQLFSFLPNYLKFFCRRPFGLWPIRPGRIRYALWAYASANCEGVSAKPIARTAGRIGGECSR